MRKVLWIGPIVQTEEVAKYKAISAAGNVWQLGFIGGLIENDIDVISVSYVPYPSWPNGPLWAKKPQNSAKEGLKSYCFGYINIIYLREFWIAATIFYMSIINIPKINEYVIFTYNPYWRHWFAAKYLKLIYGIKWVSIIADDKTHGNPDFHVFLSFDYFKRFEKINKLFCDGGIIQRNLNKNPSDDSKLMSLKSLVFTGGLGNWTGIIDFIDIFNDIYSKDFVLHIYGKGDPNRLKDKKNRIGTGVILHGFVSDAELDEACKNAYAFINPRPIDMYGSEYNFPSKLLLYLSYNKPVISTKTKGLSPDYDSILLYYHDTESLEKCIESINNLEKYENISTKISHFNPDNTWVKKVKKITNSVGI